MLPWSPRMSLSDASDSASAAARADLVRDGSTISSTTPIVTAFSTPPAMRECSSAS
jgi:hypothetical protein